MTLGKRLKRTFMAGIVLAAFVSFALIPPGFMPASGRPFLLEVCWDGLPADLLASMEPSATSRTDPGGMESMDMASMDMPAHGPGAIRRGVDRAAHRHGGPPHGEHCLFGTTCGAGPIPYLAQPGHFLSVEQLRVVSVAALALAVRVVHLPQPRAPPRRLS